MGIIVLPFGGFSGSSFLSLREQGIDSHLSTPIQHHMNFSLSRFVVTSPLVFSLFRLLSA